MSDVGTSEQEPEPKLVGTPAQVTIRRTDDELRTDGQWRVTERVSTTCLGLVKSGKLPKHLHAALEFYAMRLVQARGAAAEDSEQSTARLISNYDGMVLDPNTYGSRTPSDAQLDAQYFTDRIKQKCPREFLAEFMTRSEEEAGLLTGHLATLTQVGARFGFKSEKQCSAAGRVHIIDVLAWLNHAIREFQFEHPPSKEGRKSLHLRRKVRALD